MEPEQIVLEKEQNAAHMQRDPDFKWTSNDEAKLIAFVRQQPGLWNKHSEEYKRKDRASYIYKVIAIQLNTTAAECKHRFENNLRKKYVAETSSTKKKRSGQAFEEEIWEHTEALSFLESTIQRRKGSTNARKTTYGDLESDSMMSDDLEESVFRPIDESSQSSITTIETSQDVTQETSGYNSFNGPTTETHRNSTPIPSTSVVSVPGKRVASDFAFTPRFIKRKSPAQEPNSNLDEVFITTMQQQQQYMAKKMEEKDKVAPPPHSQESPMTSYFKYMRSSLVNLDPEKRKEVFRKVRRTFEDAMENEI